MIATLSLENNSIINNMILEQIIEKRISYNFFILNMVLSVSSAVYK